VRTLHFWRITDRSSSSSSSPGSSVSSLCRPRRPRRPLSQGPAAPAPLLIAPRARLSFSRRFPGLALAFPGRSASHRRRPSRHARRRRRQLLFAHAAPLSALKTCTEASSQPRLPTRTLYFAGHPFPRAQLLAGAAPQPVLTVVSCPHRLSPTIQCSRSTTATHCSSLTHPISLSYTRAASSTAPASSKLRRRSASPSTRRYRAFSPQPRAPAEHINP
jgi:hypothetical protein